jgi:hypothetical protein
MPGARKIPRDDTSGAATMTLASAASLERRRTSALLFRAPLGREAAEDARIADRAVWKKMLGRVLLALAPVAVLVLAMIGAGFADCRTSIAPATSAGEAQAIMEVGAARSCILRFTAAPETIQDVEVAEPPRRGSLTIRGRSGVIYHATHDFDGTDAFSLIVRGRAVADAAQTTTINVRVGTRRHDR